MFICFLLCASVSFLFFGFSFRFVYLLNLLIYFSLFNGESVKTPSVLLQWPNRLNTSNILNKTAQFTAITWLVPMTLLVLKWPYSLYNPIVLAFSNTHAIHPLPNMKPPLLEYPALVLAPSSHTRHPLCNGMKIFTICTCIVWQS